MSQRIECIILGLKPHAEKYQVVHLLCSQHGIVSGLLRTSKNHTSTTPDLFDYGSFEQKISKGNNSIFFEQYELIDRFSAIGKDYNRLSEASFLAKFILENTTHFETHATVTTLFYRALLNLNEGHSPKLITLKMLYILAREEGLPVREEWLDQINLASKRDALNILNQKIDSIPDSKSLSDTLRSFMKWLEKYDFKL